ncbi:MAG: nuclease A inhibitor family protein [Bacteroidetes bacterium]|nr:nuclease A inhibitor family protein [Fibrella sp.]
MTEQANNGDEPTEIRAPLAERVKPLLTDLLYPSESDEPVEWVTACPDTDGLLTVSQVKDWLMLPPAVFVEERPEADFWQPVTTDEDWYGPDEKARTAAFRALQATLQALTDRQVFRVGDTDIDLYLLGRLPDCSRAGLKTRVIET